MTQHISAVPEPSHRVTAMQEAKQPKKQEQVVTLISRLLEGAEH